VKLRHLIPNLFTLGNIAFGFFSMLASAQGRYERSVLCLFGAAICDLLDGKLARMLDASTKFGMELDSLSDAISFGIAPGLLVYLAILSPLGTGGAVLAIGYVLTAVIRLARYNVDTSSTLAEVTFTGMPTPIAAGYILSFVMVRQALPLALVAGGTGLIAVLMVSTLKVPKFRPGGLPFVMLVFGIGTFVAFLWRPGALTWHVWNGWNFVLLFANYVLLSRRGYLRGQKSEPSGQQDPVKSDA
jgi:CDP-diacylglycerol---serine O-phosphatidyltransferase